MHIGFQQLKLIDEFLRLFGFLKTRFFLKNVLLLERFHDICIWHLFFEIIVTVSATYFSFVCILKIEHTQNTRLIFLVFTDQLGVTEL